MLLELYYLLPIELIGFEIVWFIGDVFDDDRCLSIIAFNRGYSFDGFYDEVSPYPSA